MNLRGRFNLLTGDPDVLRAAPTHGQWRMSYATKSTSPQHLVKPCTSWIRSNREVSTISERRQALKGQSHVKTLVDPPQIIYDFK